MLCLLNIENRCVCHREHVTTPISKHRLPPRLYMTPILTFSSFSPCHPPPMLLSLVLSLYLNITPYLAGVASRHSNRTVQSPWGLWDIVSCWNGTVCAACLVCVCVCKVAKIFYKSQRPLVDLGCGVNVHTRRLSRSLCSGTTSQTCSLKSTWNLLDF